ncbi:MAG: hypothetical protein ACU837_16565 [Gammaproteobacteria bacterium]
MATYADIIPLVDTLDHGDKLRLVQALIQRIAEEEGIEMNLWQGTERKQSGLCGLWQDSRSAEVIAQEIINARTGSKDVQL